MLRKYGQVFIALFICSDILLIFLAWIALYVAAGSLSPSRTVSFEDFIRQARIFIIFIPVYLLSAQKFDFYAPRRFSNYYSEFVKVVKLITSVLVVSFFLGYIARFLEYNRIFTMFFWGVSIVLIFTYHVLVEYILKHFRAKNFNLRKILIIGSGELAKRSAVKFQEHREFGLQVVGFVTNKKQSMPGIPGIPVLGGYDELHAIILRDPPDIVFFALSAHEERLTRLLVEKISNEPVDIRIALDINGMFLLKKSFSEIDGIPVVSLRDSRLTGLQEIAKRILDLTAALIVILLLLPVLVVIAVSIKLSSRGPVFYLQERASLDGRKFKLIKFRTMCVNAEENTGPVWTVENDPRRTNIGAFLRRTGLDELPQFINVLKGEMSIVGPRPERPEFLGEFKKLYPHYMLRHMLKAGITGWAQVHGLRGNTSLGKRLEYDLYYIENYSFFLDLKIIIKTIPAILEGRGAY